MDTMNSSSRARRITRDTMPELVSLPRCDDGVWLERDHAWLRTALAICDAFAALHRAL